MGTQSSAKYCVTEESAKYCVGEGEGAFPFRRVWAAESFSGPRNLVASLLLVPAFSKGNVWIHVEVVFGGASKQSCSCWLRLLPDRGSGFERGGACRIAAAQS